MSGRRRLPSPPALQNSTLEGASGSGSRSWNLSLRLSDSHLPCSGRIRTISNPKSGHDLSARFPCGGSSDCISPRCCHSRMGLPPQEPAGHSRDSWGWGLSARQPPLHPRASLPVRQAAELFWVSPPCGCRGCLLSGLQPLRFHGGALKVVSKGPPEGLAWVRHLRSHEQGPWPGSRGQAKCGSVLAH